ncbi:MAG: hypothetical protein QW587_04940 [Candidatus Bathyarchaeia archaeon]
MREEERNLAVAVGGSLLGLGLIAAWPKAAAPTPGKGRLEAAAFLDSQSVTADILVVETGQEGRTPFSIELNPGSYTVKCTYGTDSLTQTAVVVEGQTTRLTFQFSAAPVKYTLSILAGMGGTTSPPPGSYQYSAGSQVTVQASAYSGYVFNYWTVDGAVRGENPITVVMDSDHALTAYFKSYTPTYMVSGRVTDSIDGSGINNCAVMSGSYSAHTDFDGNYRIELPAGSWTLAFYHVAYQVKDEAVIVPPSKTLNVALDPMPDVLSRADMEILQTWDLQAPPEPQPLHFEPSGNALYIDFYDPNQFTFWGLYDPVRKANIMEWPVAPARSGWVYGTVDGNPGFWFDIAVWFPNTRYQWNRLRPYFYNAYTGERRFGTFWVRMRLT